MRIQVPPDMCGWPCRGVKAPEGPPLGGVADPVAAIYRHRIWDRAPASLQEPDPATHLPRDTQPARPQGHAQIIPDMKNSTRFAEQPIINQLVELF
ncbi:hypothetical protein [Pontibacter sp. G13]|uniref:hypothetical protein n=1 Tax=Pontibacter sp. G13 TaxID=3074898 RepID=UPI0028894F76|nr:hypothetical protein [Pontibacter sp. G13]WNJ18492.1 hypothetical protein RJD25_26855 [Pontibacter sp. G13]